MLDATVVCQNIVIIVLATHVKNADLNIILATKKLQNKKMEDELHALQAMFITQHSIITDLKVELETYKKKFKHNQELLRNILVANVAISQCDICEMYDKDTDFGGFCRDCGFFYCKKCWTDTCKRCGGRFI